ncbi:MAG: hypothetical protein EZS28_046682, partial [Streblomastix strix]
NNNDNNNEGSGLYAEISGQSSNISISGFTEFINCSGAERGGGLYILYSASGYNQSGTVLLDQVSLSQCTAKNGSGIYSLLKDQGKLTIRNSNFSQCSTTTQHGGGLFIDASGNGTEISLTNSVLFDNCRSEEDGGAIYMKLYNYALADLWGVKFIGCQSVNGNGGGICAYIQSSGKLHLHNLVNFTGCVCDNKNGGGIYAQVSGNSSISTRSSLELSNQVYFDNCKSSKNNGGGIYAKVEYPATLSISETNISGCQAQSGGGFSNSGGGICILIHQKVKFSISNTNIIGCYCTSASGNGGGIYTEIQGDNISNLNTLFELNSTVIKTCNSQGQGGGIYTKMNYMCQLIIRNATFSGCKSASPTQGKGGGIFADISSTGSLLSICDKSQFISCTSEQDGGGIYALV